MRLPCVGAMVLVSACAVGAPRDRSSHPEAGAIENDTAVELRPAIDGARAPAAEVGDVGLAGPSRGNQGALDVALDRDGALPDTAADLAVDRVSDTLRPFPLADVEAATPEVWFASPSPHYEGPSWTQERFLFCSPDLLRADAAGRIYRYVEGIQCSGILPLQDGRVLVAARELGLVQIARDGSIGVLAEVGEGFMANDLTIDSRGRIFFSAYRGGKVVRLSPDGRAQDVLSPLLYANGLEVDPSGRYLYVALSNVNRMVRYRFDAGGELGRQEQVLSYPGMSPDGCEFDAWGNLWIAESSLMGESQILVLSPEHAVLARLRLPVRPAYSLTFAGPGQETVVIAAGAGDARMYRLNAGVRGFAGHPPAPAYRVIRPLPRARIVDRVIE